jgi:hypothetical protein
MDETLKRHRNTSRSWPRRRIALLFELDVAGDAVPAYFHQYEIVVTKLRPMQAVFMHMKEAD